MSEQQTVAVVTDSTADIPASMIEAEGITVVPLITAFPDGECIHDGDLTQAQFFERMAQSSELPTTSQPPVGDFVRTYESLLERFDHVVSVNISSRLSGTSAAGCASQVGYQNERISRFAW
jgi:DegV family protein with EDD domain